MKGNMHMPMDRLNRVALNRALAKAIAYRDCGKDLEAAQWSAKLLRLLHSASLLNANALNLAEPE